MSSLKLKSSEALRISVNVEYKIYYERLKSTVSEIEYCPYCGNDHDGKFKLYSTMGDMLTEITPDYKSTGFDYGKEIESFVESAVTRKPNQAHIDKAIVTSKILDAIYRSSESGREVTL